MAMVTVKVRGQGHMGDVSNVWRLEVGNAHPTWGFILLFCILDSFRVRPTHH